MEEAKVVQRVVFFVDAAHFVLTPYLGMLWCFARHFVRAPAGRQRFNVLAALNAITHELILRAGPGRLDRFPRTISGVLPGLLSLPHRGWDEGRA